MQIEIDYDMVNKIVVEDLKNAIRMTLDNPYELYFDTQKAYDLVDSMLITLEYFMLVDEFDAFVASLPEKEVSEITVTDIIENDDGSANVTFDIPSKDVAAFTGQGINYVLLKSIFDNPSDNDLIRWIKRGQEEERIDREVSDLIGYD